MMTRPLAHLRPQEPKALKLLCSCCPLPFAHIVGDKLVITSRHDNKTHSNALDVERLKQLLAVMEGKTK